MTKKDMIHYRNLLLEKRKELMNHMEIIKEVEMDTTIKESSGDHSAYSFHMADQGTDTMEREKNFFYAQRDGRLLYHIDQALLRIEDGSFGICDSCHNAIGHERLEVVPHARLCIQCKSKEEKTQSTAITPGEIE